MLLVPSVLAVRQVLKHCPKHKETRYQKAMAHVALGQLDAAEAEYRFVLRVIGHFSTAFEGLETIRNKRATSHVGSSVDEHLAGDAVKNAVDAQDVAHREASRARQEHTSMASDTRQPRASTKVGKAAGCGNCGGVFAKLAMCAGCGVVYYCSRDCQKLHRKAHKADCKRWAAEKLAEK